jgi:hypothetical protein
MSKGGGLLGLGATLAVLALVSTMGEACSSSSAAPPAADAGDAGGPADASDEDASTTPFTEAAMRAAASAFNAKYCAAFEKCDPTAFALTFGTTATCLGAGGLVAIAPGVAYVDDLAAPYAYGSRLTPDLLRACTDALDLSTCAKWVRFASERFVPDACAPAFFGMLADGSSCGAWNQCESGRCLVSPSAAEGACGRCVARKAEGEPCQPHACDAGLACLGADPMDPTKLTCTRYADVGQACDPSTFLNPAQWQWDLGRVTLTTSAHLCHDDLVCHAGTCETPPVASCDPAVGCSNVPSLHYCAPSGTCEPLPFAQRGQACGSVSTAPLGYVPCAFGSACSKVPDDAGLSTYQCLSLVKDGQACTYNPAYDHHCEKPDDRCFRDTCQRNGPAECAAPTVLP